MPSAGILICGEIRQLTKIPDIILRQRSRSVPGRENIPDLHIIVRVKRARDDLRPVQLLADHTAADGISVKTDEKIEQRRTVPDDDFLPTFLCA